MSIVLLSEIGFKHYFDRLLTLNQNYDEKGSSVSDDTIKKSSPKKTSESTETKHMDSPPTTLPQTWMVWTICYPLDFYKHPQMLQRPESCSPWDFHSPPVPLHHNWCY